MEIPNLKKNAFHPTLVELEIRVVVFSLVSNRLKVLLLPEEEGAEIQNWMLPAAPVSTQLSLEASATACIEEITGLNEVFLEQLYTYGEPERGGSNHLISVVYFALIPAESSPLGAGDTLERRWFPVEDLPPLMMDHPDIITYALRRLRYKLEYTAVGFELLPEKFTLSELQHTYELILGVTLDKRNFRRRILEAGIIEATNSQRAGEGRPAQLYRYRPDAVAEVKARPLFP